MWSIILWAFCLLSLVLIQSDPLQTAPGFRPVPLKIGYVYHSRRIRTRTPAGLGTVRAGPGEPPLAGGILARQWELSFPLGHRVRCGTLVCLGGYPYC